MGTNYYLRSAICPKCGRYDEQHIGKSSAGWEFTFQGTDTIRSYKDWLLIFENCNGQIYDEYGGKVELDEFIMMVKNKRGGRKHVTEVQKDCWFDKNGNNFYGREFS